ncbi:hypothetical protein ACIBEF_00740 [Micromonospora sp. NPDC050795]|uniref:hypothetical protein n=1 Tax=Micromonospora sp. NPDC050795 TaxID=3364282 RepID=UPI0037A2D932
MTDLWPGLAVAAVPLVHWLTGVPKVAAGGGYELAGQRIAASPLLDRKRTSRMQICLLETELAEAQVLAVRQA